MVERPDAELRSLLDHAAIDRLGRAYADGVTCRLWDQVRELFVPDATVELDLGDRPGRVIEGADALVGFVAAAVERFAFFEFVVLNSHVVLGPPDEPDRASARLFMCELRVPVGETGRDDAYGLYRDDYVRTDDGWRIARRRYRSLARFPDGTINGLPDGLGAG